MVQFPLCTQTFGKRQGERANVRVGHWCLKREGLWSRALHFQGISELRGHHGADPRGRVWGRGPGLNANLNIYFGSQLPKIKCKNDNRKKKIQNFASYCSRPHEPEGLALRSSLLQEAKAIAAAAPPQPGGCPWARSRGVRGGDAQALSVPEPAHTAEPESPTAIPGRKSPPPLTAGERFPVSR